MFVALVIQHAKGMRPIIVSSMGCPAVPHFPTLSHKQHDFRNKMIEHKTYLSISSTNMAETFLILRRTERDITNAQRCLYKVPAILSRF